MSDEKREEKPMTERQLWTRGVVESYGMRMCGKREKRILRVLVENQRNPKYPNVYHVEVSDSSAEKVKAEEGDKVEVFMYANSNPWNDTVFPSFTLAFCKVIEKASCENASPTESGTREVPATVVETDNLPF